MAATSLTIVKKRVISILMANRLNPYAGTIPVPASNSRYQDNDEINDAALENDAQVVLARIDTPGDPYRATWMSVTGDLAHGALIPAHTGAVGGVEVAIISTYAPARFASSKAEILAMRAHSTLYPNAERWAFIEDGILYHNGTNGRVWRPDFTKSAVCQSPEVDETAVVYGTVASLAKDGAVTPEIYGQCAQYFAAYLGTIKGEQITLPKVEVIENAIAA